MLPSVGANSDSLKVHQGIDSSEVWINLEHIELDPASFGKNGVGVTRSNSGRAPEGDW